MASADRSAEQRPALLRALRWNPDKLWQVWALAFVPGLAWIIVWSVAGRPLPGVIVGVCYFVVFGVAYSVRLRRRQDHARSV